MQKGMKIRGGENGVGEKKILYKIELTLLGIRNTATFYTSGEHETAKRTNTAVYINLAVLNLTNSDTRYE